MAEASSEDVEKRQLSKKLHTAITNIREQLNSLAFLIEFNLDDLQVENIREALRKLKQISVDTDVVVDSIDPGASLTFLNCSALGDCRASVQSMVLLLNNRATAKGHSILGFVSVQFMKQNLSQDHPVPDLDLPHFLFSHPPRSSPYLQSTTLCLWCFSAKQTHGDDEVLELLGNAFCMMLVQEEVGRFQILHSLLAFLVLPDHGFYCPLHLIPAFALFRLLTEVVHGFASSVLPVSHFHFVHAQVLSPTHLLPYLFPFPLSAGYCRWP